MKLLSSICFQDLQGYEDYNPLGGEVLTAGGTVKSQKGQNPDIYENTKNLNLTFPRTVKPANLRNEKNTGKSKGATFPVTPELRESSATVCSQKNRYENRSNLPPKRQKGRFARKTAKSDASVISQTTKVKSENTESVTKVAIENQFGEGDRYEGYMSPTNKRTVPEINDDPTCYENYEDLMNQ